VGAPLPTFPGMKSLEIFRPGTHTAMSGATISFSEADLAAAAAAYDPALHEAPLVVGHPRADAPAYGWVKSLVYAEGHLRALPHQVDAQFAELVRDGRFKKMSASFYTPDATANPKPGGYYLRHIGFLGAQPPSIKGLRDAAFADGEAGVVEFGDYGDVVEAGLFRRLREWFIGKFGLEEADKALPGWDIDYLKTQADKLEPIEPDPVAQAAYAEEVRMQADLAKKEADLNAQEADLKTRQAAFAESQTQLKNRETGLKRAEHATFCEDLVTSGKLAPGLKEPLLSFMASLRDEDTVAFAENGEAKTLPALAWFKDFVSSLPKQLAFGEAARAEAASGSVSFAAPSGFSVDPDALELHTKATAYQVAHPSTPYEAALSAVMAS